jgi:hypothetical protein
MPTDPVQKRLLQPLLQRRPDLAYEGHKLFFAPFTHYLRGVIFYQGWITGYLTVWPLAYQLYQGDPSIGVNDNEQQVHFEYPDSAWKDQPTQFSIDLCDRIERDFLPVVAPMKDPRTHEKHPSYVSQFFSEEEALKGGFYRFRIICGACYEGDFDRAERLSAEWESNSCAWPEGPVTDEFRYHCDLYWRMPYLLHLLRTDRRRIPALLHDWERHTVHQTNLTKYWKREPFPCELA